ncbi:TPA: L-histidine N(alpha)-methyltransferase [Salmonella enterica subsp. enterica serovar Birkenhead]
MISGVPSQDSLLPDNRHAADYQQLRERLIQELNLTPQLLHEESNLIQAGLDSIRLMRWLHWFRKNGYRLTLRELYAAPTLAAWNQLMLSRSPENAEEETLPDESSWPNMTESTPFPLTPVQHAYLTGRMPGQTLGGVGCHLYQEFEGHCLTALQLEQAITTLLQRHPMLHIAFRPDGQQVWLPQPYWNGVTVHDLRHNDAESRQAYLEVLRQRLSHRLLRVEIGETFDFQLTLLPDNRHRLHVNIDLLIMDASSFTLFFDELNALLAGESLSAIDTRYDFRSYLLHQQKINQPLRDNARAYWLAKASTLPPAPVLPLACEPATLREVRNTRRRMIVPATRWHAFSNRAGEYGVTPTMALATCFSAVLARWGGLTRLLLNITLFDRQPLHPAVGAMLADFTNILLLDTACDGDTVSNLARKNQLTFTEDWEHRHWSGIELLRELKRQQRYPHGAPVVFTSNLGRSLYSSRAESPLGEPEWGISQTPQVWLDHQVMESDGELMFSWYCMDNVLEPGAAEAMFNDYCAILQAVIAAPESLKTLASGIAGHIPRRRWPLNAQTDYDLRDIEQATLEYPGIRQTRAEIAEQGALTLDIVMADDPSPSAATPDEHDLAQLALPLPAQVQLDELEATWRWLEARALQGIAATLNRHSLFTTPEIAHRFSAIVQALSAQASHQRLLRQWLQCLTEKEWLIREGESWRCRVPLSEIPEPQEACPQSQWSQALAQYLETCIARHDALFSGQCSPLEQHRVTDALYRDNPASTCLNRYIAQIAALCGAERILEVGAGTAATTAPVLKATRNTRQSYHFTDVSAQFLNDARARLHDESRVSYALFDINQPLDFTAHPEAGYDLIVAVNVLHDASHVVQTLRRLKLLLKAGGRLLIVEATERNSVFQLASVGFIEGLSGYRDFRRRDEKPMLTRSAWQEVLVQARFANELAWPTQESSPLRQHLLLARSPGVNRPNKEAVSRYLQQRFGTGLPVLQIRQRETLFTPQHAPSDALIEPPKPTPVAGGNPALEKQVAELWQSLLSRPVARHHDFFELGGDSLMATRMVAQLNRRGIARANLQDLFSHSTLSDFCAHLQTATSGEDNPVPLCQGDGEETLFVFHASDGDISAWLPLASALNRRVFGLQAKSPLRFATLDQMIDEYVGCIRRQQPHGPYVLAGWSYGAFLAAGAAQRLYAKGEQVRMVLIDPVCRQDFCCDNRAALLRLLAEEQAPLALPEHFDQQTPGSQLADFIGLAKTAGMVSQNLTLQAAETWLDNIAHLLRLLTEHTPGESVPVPCLMVYAAGRPARWTPAETEWQGWINNADGYVIEASHWQIMMEAPHVQACAQHITRWLCATSTQPENTL